MTARDAAEVLKRAAEGGAFGRLSEAEIGERAKELIGGDLPDGLVLVAGWSEAVRGRRRLVICRAAEGGAFDDLEVLPTAVRAGKGFVKLVVERIETLVGDASGVGFSWNTADRLAALAFFPETSAERSP